jgi:hypothetical protein
MNNYLQALDAVDMSTDEVDDSGDSIKAINSENRKLRHQIKQAFVGIALKGNGSERVYLSPPKQTEKRIEHEDIGQIPLQLSDVSENVGPATSAEVEPTRETTDKTAEGLDQPSSDANGIHSSAAAVTPPISTIADAQHRNLLARKALLTAEVARMQKEIDEMERDTDPAAQDPHTKSTLDLLDKKDLVTDAQRVVGDIMLLRFRLKQLEAFTRGLPAVSTTVSLPTFATFLPKDI